MEYRKHCNMVRGRLFVDIAKREAGEPGVHQGRFSYVGEHIIDSAQGRGCAVPSSYACEPVVFGDRELLEGVREPTAQWVVSWGVVQVIEVKAVVSWKTSVQVSHDEGAVVLRGRRSKGKLQESLLFMSWGGGFNM
jgi:hypothetical protein